MQRWIKPIVLFKFAVWWCSPFFLLTTNLIKKPWTDLINRCCLYRHICAAVENTSVSYTVPPGDMFLDYHDHCRLSWHIWLPQVFTLWKREPAWALPWTSSKSNLVGYALIWWPRISGLCVPSEHVMDQSPLSIYTLITSQSPLSNISIKWRCVRSCSSLLLR